MDDFWKDSASAQRWFAGFGVTNIRHFLMTAQDFVATEAYRSLDRVGVVFVDGYHSIAQVQIDYEAFRGKLAGNGVMLFHDSRRVRPSAIYGKDRVYVQAVKDFIDRLKHDRSLQVFDLPFGDGVTLVRSVAADI